MYGPGPLRLSAMMGTYPKTAALKDGSIAPAGATLDFAPIDTAQKGFKAVVRELKFDVAEIAIVTFLQAYAAGKPYRLLPFVMNGAFHQKSILRRADDPMAVKDLAGRKVAMRSYAQTTPTWVRGILSDEYGLDLKRVHWLSQEGAHVAEYTDPAWVGRLDPGEGLEALLVSGGVDAIIAGGGLSGDPRIQPMIDHPAQAALDWYARCGATPINHMVAVRTELAEARPDLVKAIYLALIESRQATAEPPPKNGVDLQPYGFAAVEPALRMIIRFAFEQALIPAEYTVGELFGPVTGALAG